MQYPFSFYLGLILLNLSFYSTHSSHCSRFCNVAFAFTIVFNLVYLSNEKDRVLQYFELRIFLAEIRIGNFMNQI